MQSLIYAAKQGAQASLLLEPGKPKPAEYILGISIVIQASVVVTQRRSLRVLPGGNDITTAACFMLGGLPDLYVKSLIKRIATLEARDDRSKAVEHVMKERTFAVITALNRNDDTRVRADNMAAVRICDIIADIIKCFYERYILESHLKLTVKVAEQKQEMAGIRTEIRGEKTKLMILQSKCSCAVEERFESEHPVPAAGVGANSNVEKMVNICPELDFVADVSMTSPSTDPDPVAPLLGSAAIASIVLLPDNIFTTPAPLVQSASPYHVDGISMGRNTDEKPCVGTDASPSVGTHVHPVFPLTMDNTIETGVSPDTRYSAPSAIDEVSMECPEAPQRNTSRSFTGDAGSISHLPIPSSRRLSGIFDARFAGIKPLLNREACTRSPTPNPSLLPVTTGSVLPTGPSSDIRYPAASAINGSSFKCADTAQMNNAVSVFGDEHDIEHLPVASSCPTEFEPNVPGCRVTMDEQNACITSLEIATVPPQHDAPASDALCKNSISPVLTEGQNTASYTEGANARFQCNDNLLVGPHSNHGLTSLSPTNSPFHLPLTSPGPAGGMMVRDLMSTGSLPELAVAPVTSLIEQIYSNGPTHPLLVLGISTDSLQDCPEVGGISDLPFDDGEKLAKVTSPPEFSPNDETLDISLPAASNEGTLHEMQSKQSGSASGDKRTAGDRGEDNSGTFRNLSPPL